MNELISSVYFGIFVSIAVYQIGVIINKRFDKPYTNPLFLGGLIIIAIINIFKIPTESFSKGGDILEMLITPATVCLALSIYNNFEVVKKNLLAIIAGTFFGSLSSVLLVTLLCRLFSLDESVAASLFPKSVTTPIALELSRQNGGIDGIATIAVMITGIFGAMIAPVMIKLLKTKPVQSGLSIGTASHAAGTTKAIKIGDVEGALSGIAIGFSGLFTVIWAIFL